jgi:hypothetical protein
LRSSQVRAPSPIRKLQNRCPPGSAGPSSLNGGGPCTPPGSFHSASASPLAPFRSRPDACVPRR